nr:MAG TPA: hypothetical protein [Caudoviricetes sp.]
MGRLRKPQIQFKPNPFLVKFILRDSWSKNLVSLWKRQGSRGIGRQKEEPL